MYAFHKSKSTHRCTASCQSMMLAWNDFPTKRTKVEYNKSNVPTDFYFPRLSRGPTFAPAPSTPKLRFACYEKVDLHTLHSLDQTCPALLCTYVPLPHSTRRNRHFLHFRNAQLRFKQSKFTMKNLSRSKAPQWTQMKCNRQMLLPKIAL